MRNWNNKKSLVTLALVACGWIGGAGRAWGWNETGHKEVAMLAWEELTPAVRAKVAALFQKHPQYQQRFVYHDTAAGTSGPASTQASTIVGLPAGTAMEATAAIVATTGPAMVMTATPLPEHLDAGEFSFLVGAAWPDMVRTPGTSDAKYNHPVWHYVDFPYALPSYAGANPPPQPDVAWGQHADLTSPATLATVTNALQALAWSVAVLKSDDPKVTDDEKAIALCWLEHLVGDIHQPLHDVSLYSKDLPEGDKGGNSIVITARGTHSNLHSAWDSMLGTDASIGNLKNLALAINHAHPASEFKDQIKPFDFFAWTQEGLAEAKEMVYQGGNIPGVPKPIVDADRTTPVPALSVAYMEAAHALAQKNVALAGARLADCVNTIFGAEGK